MIFHNPAIKILFGIINVELPNPAPITSFILLLEYGSIT